MLDTATVRSIQRQLDAGDSQADIARAYGVSRVTIHRIAHGRTFASGRAGEPKRTRTQLSKSDQDSIRALRARSVKLSKIAEAFGVNESTVSRLANGKTFPQ